MVYLTGVLVHSLRTGNVHISHFLSMSPSDAMGIKLHSVWFKYGQYYPTHVHVLIIMLHVNACGSAHW